jgi:enoyl-CoA hydratase/carnithine racemase
MDLTDIRYEKRGRVALVTFNRPERLNAFRDRTFEELCRILEDAEADRAILGLVLTGVGRGFCSGEDLASLGAQLARDPSAESLRGQLELVQGITRRLVRHRCFTVAAINGIAVGFGAEFPLACQRRIAARSAAFMFPEVRIGLFPTNGSLYFLPRLVGIGRACDWMTTGRRVSAEEALEAGLVDRVVGEGEVVEVAVEVCSPHPRRAEPDNPRGSA